MPDSEETATARLEAALERIARCAKERPVCPEGEPGGSESAPEPRLAELAERLDALIASLGAALGRID